MLIQVVNTGSMSSFCSLAAGISVCSLASFVFANFSREYISLDLSVHVNIDASSALGVGVNS